MQVLDKSPIKVGVNIEGIVPLVASAFNTVCFINENDVVTERSVEIGSLADVIDAGYTYSSTLYNFCRAVFEQYNTKVKVISRNKRTTETYEEAYSADNNSSFYFVVIESKDVNDLTTFNTFIQDELKLQFFSSMQDLSLQVSNRKMVYFYQPYFDFYLLYDSTNIVELDSGDYVHLASSFLEENVTTKEEADSTPLLYPEAAWIGVCGNYFPSRTQWLYKELLNIPVFDLTSIPDYSHIYTIVHKSKATLGTGCLTNDVPIEQQISLDWNKYALQKNCWNLLYSSPKVNATREGVDQFELKIREVLDVCVREGIYTSYIITERNLNRINGKVSFKFIAYLQYSILGVDKVEGVVYQ